MAGAEAGAVGEAALRCRAIEKRFLSNGRLDPDRPVLAGVDLDVPPGSLTAVLGPSGGGKTTLLRIVAGLETADAGEVRVLGQTVTGTGVFVPPESRRVGLVFQEYALFPHLSALENVAFGVPGPAGLTKAWGALQMVGLSEVAGHRPHELSGGEQQRVALARALAPEPAVVLLDEPFSNLDAPRRAGVREEVAQLLRRLDATAVLVTHDREEAFLLADQVVLLLDGRVVRSGRPEELARHPGSRAGAEFLGETNFLPGESDGKSALCEIGRVEILPPASGGEPPRGPVEVLLPLDGLLVEPFAEEDRAGSPVAVLTRAAFHGAFQLIEARLPSGRSIAARSPAREIWQGLLRPGQRVGLRPAGPVPVFPRGRT
ncbi:MAG: ABC transporter ATP-binding protein [Acidobacteriota bacterium]|nr:ABC transporter ATP-binding protein [Acidobacteriota bacterium]